MSAYYIVINNIYAENYSNYDIECGQNIDE